MADYKVTDTQLTSIANAIRTKGETSSPLEFPDGFVSAVQNIPTGGSSVLVTKAITQNGTYSAEDDNADGYSEVTVNVQSGGNSAPIELDFTKMTGTVRNVTFGSTGAVMSSDQNGVLYLSKTLDNNITFEIDITQIRSTSSTRRFLTVDGTHGLVFWPKLSFFGSAWAGDSSIGNASYFDNSKMSVYIDSNNYWHVYKDGVLVYEPNQSYGLSGGCYQLGGLTSEASSVWGTIKSVKIYQGLHLPT